MHLTLLVDCEAFSCPQSKMPNLTLQRTRGCTHRSKNLTGGTVTSNRSALTRFSDPPRGTCGHAIAFSVVAHDMPFQQWPMTCHMLACNVELCVNLDEDILADGQGHVC